MDTIIQKIAELWLYDVNIFSQPWIYYWALVPFTLYFSFFTIKWVILTMPLWLPFTIVIGTFRKDPDEEEINGKLLNIYNVIAELKKEIDEIAKKSQ